MSRKKTLRRLGEELVLMRRALATHGGQTKFDMPLAQKELLFIIAQHEGMSVRDTADTLRITSGAATQLLESLVKSRMIIRETDTKDHRSVRVHMSPEGRKAFHKLLKTRTAFVEHMFKELSDEEVEAFYELLSKIRAHG